MRGQAAEGWLTDQAKSRTITIRANDRLSITVRFWIGKKSFDVTWVTVGCDDDATPVDAVV